MKNEDYEETSSQVYMRTSYASQLNAIAAAILALAEAVKYHAEVTANVIPETEEKENSAAPPARLGEQVAGLADTNECIR